MKQLLLTNLKYFSLLLINKRLIEGKVNLQEKWKQLTVDTNAASREKALASTSTVSDIVCDRCDPVI